VAIFEMDTGGKLTLGEPHGLSPLSDESTEGAHNHPLSLTGIPVFHNSSGEGLSSPVFLGPFFRLSIKN
jgi:hypothetical protein